MDDAARVIRDLGFPIFVAIWLLIQGNRQHAANLAVLEGIERRLAELSTATSNLAELVRKLVSDSRRRSE